MTRNQNDRRSIIIIGIYWLMFFKFWNDQLGMPAISLIITYSFFVLAHISNCIYYKEK